MKYIPLKDICSINMGQSPDSKSYNYNKDGLPFFQGNADFGERYPITRVWCNDPTKIAHAGDILISVRAPIGALNYAKEDCCIGRGLAALTPDSSRLSPDFLYWLLYGKTDELNSSGTGTTFKAISRKVLEETPVPDIALWQQAELSGHMERIYGIIKFRKQQLAKLDELVKARFVEMFGGVTETVPLSHYIFGLVAGKSLASEAECPNKVLKTGAVTHDYFDATQVKNLPANYHPIPDHQVNKGDILISRMNTVELVGAAAYVWDAPKNTYLPDRLWRAELQSDTNPVFVWQLLVQPTTKREIRSIASGTSGSMKNISKQGLLSVSAKRIPFDLQNQFAAFVTQVEKSKAAVQSALDKAQLLFDSLMQKYFG